MVEQERGKMIDDEHPLIANGQINKSTSSAEKFSDFYIPVDSHHLLLLPDFGIWHLTIKEAAELVALDMWYSGEIPDIQEPEDWDGREHDPKLLALLAGHVAVFETRLIAAVDSGKIEATVKRRDFDERLIPEETYIKEQNLHDWLSERGYESGDIMNEWVENANGMASHIGDELIYLRTASKRNIPLPDITLNGMLARTGDIDETEVTNVIAAYKALIIENQQLKEQLTHARTEQPAKVDRPLATRQRRTLLTIIAALCEYSAIAPTGKNAAGQIAKLTEDIGANVTDETIAKALAEIPDALETRIK